MASLVAAIQLSTTRLVPAATTAAATTATAAAVAATARLLLLEAVSAVHGAIASRLERHFGLAAAVRALRRIHLARARRVAAAAPSATVPAAATTTIAAGSLAGTPAVRAALRLVRETTTRVEFLVVGCEDELRSTIDAGQISVGEWHLTTLL